MNPTDSHPTGVPPLTNPEHWNPNSETLVHPFADFLSQYQWEGMITIRFECGRMSKDNAGGQFQRKDLLCAFMNDLRKKWRIRKKEINWVAATEYGDTGTAHIHLIFSFHPLTSKGREFPNLDNFEKEALESLRHICRLQKIPDRSTNFHWAPTWENSKLVEYVCKMEFGRPDKHFEWSREGRAWEERSRSVILKAVIAEVEREFS
jgi:hypothetical protein